MRNRQEIIREILFHTKESNRLKKLGKFSAAELTKCVHDGRVIGLRWVIGEVNTPIKTLKKELVEE